MKALRSALSAWEPQASAQRDPLAALRAEWAAIVGGDVAANSRPVDVVREALLIVTRTSAWSQQLGFLSERILAAVYERTGLKIERLRFRVGRISEQAREPARKPGRARPSRPAGIAPAASLQDAFARFQADVAAAQRAKAQAGWKECSGCGVRILPSPRRFCAPCQNAHAQERDARVARLLFEVPWLGYADIAPLVEGLSAQEYYAIRLRLLRRWSDMLERVRRTGGAQLTTRDRMVASSYVLLKSEVDPERIAPAVVRDLLGDELHDIFYGNPNN